jgi:hypothetical protein
MKRSSMAVWLANALAREAPEIDVFDLLSPERRAPSEKCSRTQESETRFLEVLLNETR